MAEKPSRLICIEYPAKVNNVDKMVETLGGLESMNEVFSTPNRRLELRFRPESFGCKPACGEKTSKSTSMVIKVRRQKNSVTNETRIVHEILDPVDATYQFHNLADFQYLPMIVRKSDDNQITYEDIEDRVKVNVLKSLRDLNADDCPLFLLPAAFSRMDTPQDYFFRKEAREEKTNNELPENIIGRTRQRRSLHNIFVTYEVEAIPEKPKEGAGTQLAANMIDASDVERIKAMFRDQPVWLKAALVHLSGIPGKKVKFILPVVAYYFSSGPWRNQWVRFGYDPRLDSSAGPYQTLDYRLRIGGGARNLIKVKRANNVLNPYRSTNTSKPRTSLIQFDSNDPSISNKTTEEAISNDEEENERIKDHYIFRPGRLPPSRQMFYQYQSIEIPEAQVLIGKYRSVSDQCNEKNGWYKSGLDVKLRNILAETIKKACFEDDSMSFASSTAATPLNANLSEEEDSDSSASE